MAQKATHYLFKFFKDGKNGRRYYFSLRPVNDPKNSVDDKNFKSRPWRNKMASRAVSGKLVMDIAMDPKTWLKNR